MVRSRRTGAPHPPAATVYKGKARAISLLLLAAGSLVSSTSAVKLGGFEVVGTSGVSAMMMFNSADGKVMIIDKTEGNALQIAGHPAWGVEYDTNTNNVRAMDVVTNSFCAGGMSLGNGTWVNVGGNEPVTHGGEQTSPRFSPGPYDDGDGGAAIRLLTPCDDGSCDWVEGNKMVGGRRWYPTVEALEDGSVVIIGGNQWGGYASGAGQDNPTYEFWPPRGDSPVDMSTFLGERTRPLDMYPLTWLMKSGRLFLQAAYAAILWDLDSASEVVTLPDIPKAARVYPASAGVAMLPMTPANNYEQTVLFCGGVERALEEFGSDAGPAYNPIPFAASKSCERITPEADNANWTKDDDLITGRSMGTFVYLPDGKLWFAQGAQYGTAGYSKQTYNAYMNQSLGDDPEYQPYLYDPYAPSGQRFSTKGLSNSTVPRLYHSSALLLEDGSVMSAGSNPNTDVTTSHWPTEYRVEKWYPLWYSEQRPSKLNITQLLYGGGFFDVPLSSSDLSNNITNIQTAKVVIIRNGFATHGVNWGMRYLELNSTYTADQNGGSNGTLHVSNMPGSEHQGPNIFQPGPAMAFLVVNGIPSYGQHIMVGNGKIGNQRATTNANLPPNQDPPAPQQSVAAGNSQRAGEKTGSNASASGSGSGSGSSGADHLSQKVGASLLAAALVGATALL